MKWLNSEVLFIVVAVLYFASRKPVGGLEMTADVLMVIALVLIVVKHIVYRWYK
ncbi:hypothetical protein SpAn4DRAFT_2514 [Sporomusa ovata]|uniref:Uncharacterized protein n=1 Tax=Sporomusa ovata TaxID=2378 RepID=A0A0U1L0U2_9FIRM|nr:hypothetical protein [Sporomusa ovata]CQR73282.1 hypothetical protein SpAn4DRAFT_2514 [Sporomusa ovata]